MRQRAALLKRILIACPNVVNERDRQGNSPLHLATLHSAGMATIETLLKFGSDIRSRNNRKRTCVEICNEKMERIIERTRGANGDRVGLTVSEFYAQSTHRALMIAWGNLEARARAAAQSLLGSGPQKKEKKSKKKSKKKTMLSNTSSTDSSSSCSTPTEEDEIKLPEGSYSEVFDALSAIELESYTDRLRARDIGVENAMDLIYLDDEILGNIGMKERDRKILLDFADIKSGQLSDWLRKRRMEKRLNSRLNNGVTNTEQEDDGGEWTTYRRKTRHRGEKKTFGAKSLIDRSPSGRRSKNTKKKSRASESKKKKKKTTSKPSDPSVVKNNVMKRVSPPNKKSFASVVRKENSVRNTTSKEEKKRKEARLSTNNTTISVNDLKSYISSSNARLAAVDIEPSHIVGIDLDHLSIAQLEMLEKFHLNQVSKIMEQKVLKTQDLEKSKREEFERLQKQIEQLSNFTRPTESII